jgi:hypothetical protein
MTLKIDLSTSTSPPVRRQIAAERRAAIRAERASNEVREKFLLGVIDRPRLKAVEKRLTK